LGQHQGLSGPVARTGEDETFKMGRGRAGNIHPRFQAGGKGTKGQTKQSVELGRRKKKVAEPPKSSGKGGL